jgi:hypothetical protein
MNYESGEVPDDRPMCQPATAAEHLARDERHVRTRHDGDDQRSEQERREPAQLNQTGTAAASTT